VLAYSTISQLGYMMAALGVGAYGVAIFHLFTHAFFKALLFLGAGSVNHATGTFDMRYMGGLRRQMPWTYLLMAIGSLSLMGIFPLAGFWSKDEVLLGVWNGNDLLDTWVSRLAFAFLIAGVFLTAFYTLRMVYLTFHGEFRGGMEAEVVAYGREPLQASHVLAETSPHSSGHTAAHSPAGAAHHGGVHLAESPLVMVVPMVALGIAAFIAGYVANPQGEFLSIPKHWITQFLVPPLADHVAGEDFSVVMALVSTGVALAGVALATVLYLGQRGPQREPLETIKPAHTLLAQKYYVDELYENLVVRKGFYRILAGTIDWLDRNLVDWLVDSLGWVVRSIGRPLAWFQTGQVQGYGMVIALGTMLIIVGYLIFG
jgi:NADH:ubiquinone oxidoreductase subunit 5 (subunit L)/multisubunit Na+/H+ antiporter MnhA subunit